MPDEPTSIHINFTKPIPLFPLDQVALMPQQVLPLHIFEPRYRQMVSDALDGPGLIAMGVFDGSAWKQSYHGRPPLRPAACIGHIHQHEKLPDGRYNLLLHGVCRARIIEELAPDQGRLYRMALFEPLDAPNAPELSLDVGLDEHLAKARAKIATLLDEGAPLGKLAAAQPVLEYVRNEELPTPAILELVSMALATEPKVRYRLLAEGDPRKRADVLMHELEDLATLVRRAIAQHPERWPKGQSWN